MSLADKLKGVRPPSSQRSPVWKGPREDGITFSLLSRFLTCRERFRITVIEGLKPVKTFNHRIEYGNMWHACEEAYAEHQSVDWLPTLNVYCADLARKYPMQQDQIHHWYNVCKIEFPEYVKHWSHHPDNVKLTPVAQEQVFNIPYDLPSGRTVRLRGKFDGVDAIGKDIYLFETKTKGDIDEVALQRQLTMDFQTGIYMTVLQQMLSGKVKYDGPPEEALGKRIMTLLGGSGGKLRGVRYNVVRRPLSGGKNTIRQTKNETEEQFYERLGGLIQEDPGYYFMRWKIDLGSNDIDRFRVRCLNPILEQLCDWWEHVSGTSSRESPFDCRPAVHDYMIHWQHPFGVRNSLDEGGHDYLDEYINNGSTAGLERVDNLFPEL